MSGNRPEYMKSISECVDSVISGVGGEICLGMPIGVGKPTLVANEFYRRAAADSSINLTLLSGLTLVKPGFSSELERRFMEPIVKRVFGDYPDPVYVVDARRGKLPENVQIVEFFLLPGTLMGSVEHQQNHISSNYTHVGRDAVDMGLNVVASMVGKGNVGGKKMFSLGSNADAPLDMLMGLHKKKADGHNVAVIGQVNANMPFMYGAAALEPDNFDYIVDSPDFYHKLFGPPKEPVSTVDYFIGLYASGLVRDGGTLQIGIGSLGDAVAYALQLRHSNNNEFLDVMTTIGGGGRFSDSIKKMGALSPFKDGLYGCTELLTDAFVRLLESGVISRKVYGDKAVQSLVNQKLITEIIDGDVLDKMLEQKLVSEYLNKDILENLKYYGVFKPDVSFEDGMIVSGNGKKFSANIGDAANRKEIAAHCLGDRLKNGVLIHSGFFLGPQSFYDELRAMSEESRARIHMREITFCNQLYGGEELKLLQRGYGRFFNTAMMVTLNGAAVSDGLEDGRVVSGVGGQYNFVSMAHALPESHSIILVRSTKEIHGKIQSNIVFNYGHTTIPRHLRDIYVTEYGIADVRGKTDRDVMKSLINIADSRFQKQLLKKAKEARKIPADYEIPERFTHNYPDRLEKELAKYREKEMFKPFPYGTDLTDMEIKLGKSLREFKEKMESPMHRMKSQDFMKLKSMVFSPPAAAKPFLERMGLDKPADKKEKLLQRLVTFALSMQGYV